MRSPKEEVYITQVCSAWTLVPCCSDFEPVDETAFSTMIMFAGIAITVWQAFILSEVLHLLSAKGSHWCEQNQRLAWWLLVVYPVSCGDLACFLGTWFSHLLEGLWLGIHGFKTISNVVS
jgi:hypothetical protein